MTETDGSERMAAGGESSDPMVSCLCLTGRRDVVEPWKQFFTSAGIDLVLHVPASIAMACSFVRHQASALALAHVPSAGEIGGALSGLFPIRTVRFPPLVVIVDRAITDAERERLRLQGAAHIVERPLTNDRDGSVLRQLVHSGSWFKGTTDRLAVTDAIQMLAAGRMSGMLTVGCPHAKDIHSSLWHEAGPCIRRRIRPTTERE